MKTTTTALKFSDMPKSYAGLVSLLVPRPIHDRTTYENAIEVAHALAGFKLNRDQDDYLELIAKLIEDYERETIPEHVPAKSIDALKFLMVDNGLTGDDLGRIISVDRSLAYRILKGTRKLTADHIKKLSARFAVSSDVFLA